jgi:hypothetical protein
MGMKKTLDVINAMETDGVIGRYAVAGAIAAYNYIEPTVTEHLDILISFDAGPDRPRAGLITLAPIFSYLKSKGYGEFRKEGLLIEGWPVQFLPAANDLDAEAIEQAQDVEIQIDELQGIVRTRVLRPEHLIAIALRVGRPPTSNDSATFSSAIACPMRGVHSAAALVSSTPAGYNRLDDQRKAAIPRRFRHPRPQGRGTA